MRAAQNLGQFTLIRQNTQRPAVPKPRKPVDRRFHSQKKNEDSSWTRGNTTRVTTNCRTRASHP